MADHSTLAPIMLDDPAPFLIDSEAQLAYLLGRLAKRPELVCLYPHERREPFALSALLHIGDDHLIFDSSPDEHINNTLERAPGMICVGNLDMVHVQFETSTPIRIEYEGRAALRTTRPQSLLFIQRRDYFRLSVPPRQPVLCHIPQGQDGHKLSVEIIDISLGGIALPGPLPFANLAPGSRLQDCRIELPETGSLQVDLMICSLRENRLRDGSRIGCRFMQLSGGDQTLIQRYINRIERRRLARE